MIKIKLSAGSNYSKPQEARAIKKLKEDILSREDGYLIPVMFVGKQLTNHEIDAVLLLPDIIFFIDFKEWPAQRIEVPGLNGAIRRFVRGGWEEGDNTLVNYEYAARIMADKLKKSTMRGWLSTPPRIHSVLVFTRPPSALPARISFAGR